MGFSLRQAFNAGFVAMTSVAMVAELNAHNPQAALGFAFWTGANIVVAGLTTNQPR